MAVTVIPDIATGLAIATFTGIAQTFQVEDFTLPAAVGEAIQSTHQASTTSGHTYVPADFHDPGEVSFVVQHDQDYDYHADVNKACTAAGEGVVLTVPGTGSVKFDGVYLSYTPQQSTLNEKMLADLVVKVSGDVTVVPGA